MPPPNNKPAVPDVVERFAGYYQANATWGSLHIVLEDGNVSDRSVEFCEQYAKESGDLEGAELAATLLRMSKTQRLKLSSAVEAWLRQHTA